jgi:hypothetical protein
MEWGKIMESDRILGLLNYSFQKISHSKTRKVGDCTEKDLQKRFILPALGVGMLLRKCAFLDIYITS